MIDLNRQSKTEEKDAPMGVIILTLIPMVWLFWSLIEWGL